MAPSGTVLLVNSFDGREMYADYMRGNALIVRHAESPEAAFGELDAADPHVVVTDIAFPRSAVDGATAADLKFRHYIVRKGSPPAAIERAPKWVDEYWK